MEREHLLDGLPEKHSSWNYTFHHELVKRQKDKLFECRNTLKEKMKELKEKEKNDTLGSHTLALESEIITLEKKRQELEELIQSLEDTGNKMLKEYPTDTVH